MKRNEPYKSKCGKQVQFKYKKEGRHWGKSSINMLLAKGNEKVGAVDVSSSH